VLQVDALTAAEHRHWLEASAELSRQLYALITGVPCRTPARAFITTLAAAARSLD